MITKTKEHSYSGINYSVEITKSEAETYTAKAKIKALDNVVLVFPDGMRTGLCKQNYPAGSGSYLNANPYQFIVEYVEGFIDSIIDSSVSQEFIGKKPGETMADKPVTEDDLKAAVETERLFELYSPSGVHHLCKLANLDDVQDVTVRQWRFRGKIPKAIVHSLAQLKQVHMHGFTRESLRPDISSWLEIDYPVEEKGNE